MIMKRIMTGGKNNAIKSRPPVAREFELGEFVALARNEMGGEPFSSDKGCSVLLRSYVAAVKNDFDEFVATNMLVEALTSDGISVPEFVEWATAYCDKDPAVSLIDVTRMAKAIEGGDVSTEEDAWGEIDDDVAPPELPQPVAEMEPEPPIAVVSEDQRMAAVSQIAAMASVERDVQGIYKGDVLFDTAQSSRNLSVFLLGQPKSGRSSAAKFFAYDFFTKCEKYPTTDIIDTRGVEWKNLPNSYISHTRIRAKEDLNVVINKVDKAYASLTHREDRTLLSYEGGFGYQLNTESPYLLLIDDWADIYNAIIDEVGDFAKNPDNDYTELIRKLRYVIRNGYNHNMTVVIVSSSHKALLFDDNLVSEVSTLAFGDGIHPQSGYRAIDELLVSSGQQFVLDLNTRNNCKDVLNILREKKARVVFSLSGTSIVGLYRPLYGKAHATSFDGVLQTVKRRQGNGT